MISSPEDTTAGRSGALPETPSNGQLLRAFVQERDEAAFEGLVRRHGPMVFGVCRRLLGNEHDAADAFQAVFLVLARKAAVIRAPEVLGTWLYNVAYRTSIKARSVRLKRAARERQVSVMPEPAVECPVEIDDLSEVLDEELRALSAPYQSAIILCDLQGQSRKQAAATLKIAEGTLSSRLAEGRQKLAVRLRRRGVEVSATALAVTLGQSAAQASLPAPLIVTTVKAAALPLTGQAAAGVVSANTLTLVSGVLNGMLLAKVKAAVLALLGLCALVGAVQVGRVLVNDEQNEESRALAVLTKLGARLRWQAAPKGKQQLVMVDLKGTKVQDEHVKVLGVFKELRELSLNQTAISDTACGDLPRLVKLVTLDLNGTAISDAGVKQLASLTNLQVLALGWTKTADAGCKELAPLVELRELDLRHTGVTDAGVKQLAPLQKLHTVEMGKTGVTDAGMRHFGALRGLRTLRLESTAVTDKGLGDLAAGGQIETLSLDGNSGVTDAGLKELLPLEKLLGLNLSGTSVTDTGVPQLAAFKQLRYLGLDRTGVTGSGFAAPTVFKLSTLWLSESKVTDTSLSKVAEIATLQHLHLDRTGITDVAIKRVAPLKNLGMLALANTPITDACAPDFASFPKLWLLNLSGTKITDAALIGLGRMPRLRWLELHATPVTDAGLKHLAPLRGLETLWLSWTKVSDAGLKELAPFKRLGNLRLGGVPVTDAGLKDLTPLTNLHTLWLDWTKITDDGLKELTALKRLKELRLDGTAVTAAGLTHLAALPQLERLELQKTEVTETTAVEVKAALPRVIVNTRPPDQPATQSEDPPRYFWWLLLIMAGLAAGTLLAWLIVKRRNLQWRGVTAMSLLALAGVLLILVGEHAFQGSVEAVQPVAPPLRERVLRGHTGPIHAVCFTPDARRLISVSGWPGNDNSVRIWNLASDTELFRIPAPGQVGSLALSADGRHVLAGALGGILYIDIETGKVLKRLGRIYFPCSSIGFAADGRHVYSAMLDGFARRWDLRTGNEVARFRVADKWARYAAELPNGRLVTADNKGTIQIWDIQSGKELKRIDAELSWMTTAALAPDKNHLLTGTWQAIKWNLETGDKVQIFQGHKSDVQSITLSPDGKTLLTTSTDGSVHLWDFESAAPLQVLMTQDDFMYAASFSQDGRWIAAAGGGRKDGDRFVGGTQHDIHIFEMPQSAPPAATADATSAPWLRNTALLAVAGMLALTAVVLLRRRSSQALPPRASNGTEATHVAFICAHCGKHLRANARLAGKKVKCPQCAVIAAVPALRLPACLLLLCMAGPALAEQKRAHDFRGARFDPEHLQYGGPTSDKFWKLEAEGLRLRYTGAGAPPTNNPSCVAWRVHVCGNFVATARYEILKCEPPSKGTFLAGAELYVKLDNPNHDAIMVARGVYPKGSAAFDFKVLSNDAKSKRITKDFKSHPTTATSLRGRLRLARDGPIVTASFAEGEEQQFTEFQRSEIGTADVQLVRFAGIAGGDRNAILDMRILEFQLEGEELGLGGRFVTPLPKMSVSKTSVPKTEVPKPEVPKAKPEIQSSAGRDEESVRDVRNAQPNMKTLKEYYHSFKNDGDRNLDLDGLDPGDCVHFEPEGLRISFPLGHPDRRMGTGLRTNFGLKGDFEITMSYEILDEPKRTQGGLGTGLYLWADFNLPGMNRAILTRAVYGWAGLQYTTWLHLTHEGAGKPTETSERFPTTAKAGQLRLVRTGDVLAYYAAKQGADDFTLLRKEPAGTEEVTCVRIGGHTGGPEASLEFRVTDLRIRAESLPDLFPAELDAKAEMQWMPIALASSLAVVLALVGWWYVERRRAARSGKGSPAAAPAAPLVSFPCPTCAKKLRTRQEMAGRRVKCPSCGNAVLVPASAATEPASVPATEPPT